MGIDMVGKKVTVKEMKHDGLVDAVATTATFFERHRGPLIILAVAVVAAAVTFSVISYRTTSRDRSAVREFSAAGSIEEMVAVYESYPRTPTAPLALIQAGAFAFREGEYGPARNYYLLFRENYPEHILAGFAQMGIAASLAAEGRWDEALAAYDRLISSYPDSALVPRAYFNRGRCLRQAGESEQARREFQMVFERFPQSPYAFLAREEWVALAYSR